MKTGSPARHVGALVALAVVLLADEARASACCMSASVTGIGRLAIWEQAATGVLTAYGHGTGLYTASSQWRNLPEGVREDDLRFDAWALVRLAESWQVTARVPWVVGLKSAGETSSAGAGFGDVMAGVRWDAIGLGEFAELPGIALMATVTAPTGRRPEQAFDALGATATGRGAWALSAAVAVERAVVPWFLRADAAFTWYFSFQRADTGEWQQFGPGLNVGLSGGYELKPDVWVLALVVRLDHEWPLRVDGEVLDDSSATALTTSLSTSVKVTPKWTLTGALATDVLGRLGVAQNRPERLTFSLGVRYGFF
ncbi:MAG: hypothetical protein AB1938_22245 [Myxococcota bacterium]